MAVNQDDLLIFKMRPTGSAKGKPYKAQQVQIERPQAPLQQVQQQVAPQPALQQQQATPVRPVEDTKARLAAQEAAIAAERARVAAELEREKAIAKQRQQQQQRPRPVEDVVQEPQARTAIEQRSLEDNQRQLEEQARRELERVASVVKTQEVQRPQEEMYIIAPDTASVETETAPPQFDIKEQVEEAVDAQAKQLEIRRQRRNLKPKEIRKVAAKMSCVNHPWRKAYAICDVCQRPFCYEDIVEHGGKYYCFDDIGSAPSGGPDTQMIKYNSIGMVAAVLFFGLFVAFLYLSYTNLEASYSIIASIGFHAFIAQINQDELLLFGGLLISILAFAASILILLESSDSFKTAAGVGVIGMVLFGYQYESTLSIDYGVLAGISFIALLMLVYGRVYVEPVDEEAQQASATAQMLEAAKMQF